MSTGAHRHVMVSAASGVVTGCGVHEQRVVRNQPIMTSFTGIAQVATAPISAGTVTDVPPDPADGHN